MRDGTVADSATATTFVAPAPESGRKHTEVAVGILLRADGAMLLSTRPPGKPYAGYWEFPGVHPPASSLPPGNSQYPA
jgi:8-oxo-dGTP diphosphatase